MQRRAAHLQRRLVLAGAAGATTWLVGRHFDRQRRSLGGHCEASTTSDALASLRTHGVSVVSKVVDESLVSAVKATEVYRAMPTAQPERPRDKPSKEWRRSSLGRYHRREEAMCESDVNVLERVEQRIWPLVEGFFREEGVHDMRAIYRSELQILNAVPGSVSQTWHSDNRSRGLSIIVPLVPFSAANGGTQVLVGSHAYDWALIAREGARVVHAPVGAVAAYDSRTYHRGLGNETEEGRPALIFCYDRISSPPPGCGVLGSLANANLAGLLNILSAGWNAACAAAGLDSGFEEDRRGV